MHVSIETAKRLKAAGFSQTLNGGDLEGGGYMVTQPVTLYLREETKTYRTFDNVLLYKTRYYLHDIEIDEVLAHYIIDALGDPGVGKG